MLRTNRVRLILGFLASTALTLPATAQQSTVPYVVNGATSTGALTYCPVGTGAASACNLPVSATTSVAGFQGTAGATASLAASGTSADVALPAGTDVVLTNPSSTVTAFFRYQVGAGTALTTDQPILPGAAIGIHVGTATHLSAITSGGSVTLQIQGGSGLATGYGGGSGSGTTTAYAQGSTTSGQNVTPAGCRTLTSLPTDTTGQTNMPACTTSGEISTHDATLATLAAEGVGNTGSAVPAQALYTGINVSGNLTGATGTSRGLSVDLNAADPCTGSAKLGAVINLTGSGQIITGTAAKKTYICAIHLVSATAQNIALVEGTGTVCATNIFGLAGGTTAATGWNFAANGGLAEGSGNGTDISPSADTNASAANVCLLLSSTGQTSGHISYVQQ